MKMLPIVWVIRVISSTNPKNLDTHFRIETSAVGALLIPSPHCCVSLKNRKAYIKPKPK